MQYKQENTHRQINEIRKARDVPNDSIREVTKITIKRKKERKLGLVTHLQSQYMEARKEFKVSLYYVTKSYLKKIIKYHHS